MNIQDDQIIEKFLRNTLSEKERKEVLDRIEIDNGFREKVGFEKQLFLNLNKNEWSLSTNHNLSEIKEYEALFKDKTTEKLKNTLTDVNTEYQNSREKKSKYWLLYTGIASILILIGVSVFLSNRDTSSNELYASYLELSSLPSFIKRGKTNQKNLVRIQQLFEAKKYNKVLEITGNDLNKYTKNKAAIYLYTGISYMELNKFDEAEKTIDLLINSDLIDSPKGIWYKALLYIKQDKTKQAKQLLIQIAKKPNNYKYKEASELLDKL